MDRERDPPLRFCRSSTASGPIHVLSVPNTPIMYHNSAPLLLADKRIRRAFPIFEHVLPAYFLLLFSIRRSEQVQRELSMRDPGIRGHTSWVHQYPRCKEDRVRYGKMWGFGVLRWINYREIRRVEVRANVGVRVVLRLRLVRLAGSERLSIGRFGLRSASLLCSSRSVGRLDGLDLGVDVFHAFLRLPHPEIAAEPGLRAVEARRVRVALGNLFVPGGGVEEVGSGTVADACVVRLGGVDDVRAGLAAEDLEREVTRVPC